MTQAESGRYAILAGWVIALLGVLGYVLAMTRAGKGADILDALTGQGALGWASGALLLGGVAIWLLGNITLMHHAAESADEADAP